MEKEYAILRLNLIDTIPAYELSRLTSVINDIYDIFLEIENANHYKRLSSIFLPCDEEKLYIKKASIGTPNSIEFLGVGEHLLNAVNFLGKNFNPVLSIKSANILRMNKSDSIFDYINRIKEVLETKPLPEYDKDTENLIGNFKSLEEELTKLKKDYKLEEATNEEKSDYINYVRNISGLSQNIITQAELIIIKPTS
jgi:hypothetical protein